MSKGHTGTAPRTVPYTCGTSSSNSRPPSSHRLPALFRLLYTTLSCLFSFTLEIMPASHTASPLHTGRKLVSTQLAGLACAGAAVGFPHVTTHNPHQAHQSATGGGVSTTCLPPPYHSNLEGLRWAGREHGGDERAQSGSAPDIHNSTLELHPWQSELIGPQDISKQQCDWLLVEFHGRPAHFKESCRIGQPIWLLWPR